MSLRPFFTRRHPWATSRHADPFGLVAFQRDADAMIASALRAWDSDTWGVGAAARDGHAFVGRVTDEGTHTALRVALPGVPREGVSVDVEAGRLSLRATADGPMRIEFAQSLQLPKGIDERELKAEYVNEELTVLIPKPAEVVVEDKAHADPSVPIRFHDAQAETSEPQAV